MLKNQGFAGMFLKESVASLTLNSIAMDIRLLTIDLAVRNGQIDFTVEASKFNRFKKKLAALGFKVGVMEDDDAQWRLDNPKFQAAASLNRDDDCWECQIF